VNILDSNLNSPLQTNNTKPLSIEDTTKELEIILTLPKEAAEERAMTWIRTALYLIKPEQVQEAIVNNLAAEQVLFGYLHLTNPLVAVLARPILGIFWESISYFLYDARRLFNILSANPDVAIILNTDKGKTWLNQCCVNGVVWLYNYIWPPPPVEII
jgi:hypothetical protein